jgi:hypothetical protein
VARVAKLTRQERIEIARTRLVRILGAHSIATMRTLEMKITDAGPYNQRINPHILTEARKELIAEGVIQAYRAARSRPPWYYLGNTRFSDHAERYEQLETTT